MRRLAWVSLFLLAALTSSSAGTGAVTNLRLNVERYGDNSHTSICGGTIASAKIAYSVSVDATGAGDVVTRLDVSGPVGGSLRKLWYDIGTAPYSSGSTRVRTGAQYVYPELKGLYEFEAAIPDTAFKISCYVTRI